MQNFEIFLHMNKFKFWGYCMCFVKLITKFLPVLCLTQPYACWKMGLGWDSMLQCPWKMLHSKKKKKDDLYPVQSVTVKDLPDGFLLSDIQNVEPKSIALHMYNQV